VTTTSPDSPGPRTSPLHLLTSQAGARYAPFAGWSMPLDYAGGGAVAEHDAVRSAVGVFDVSHLGTLSLRGPGGLAHLDRLLTAPLADLPLHTARYTLLCDESGGVVDDMIVYHRGVDDVLVVPNASNTAAVRAAVAVGLPAAVRLADPHGSRAILAVQGPGSAALLADLGVATDDDALPYLGCAGVSVAGVAALVARSGYTGERGYELITDAADAGAVWSAVLGAGAARGARPAGLAARDILRTEMGYPLHGQDLSATITPVQARLGWAVGWDKPAFAGRDALLAERAAGPARRLWGLRAADRSIPRPGMAVRDLEGRGIGAVTSGTFSPTLGVGVGLALLADPVGPGDEVLVDLRGRDVAMAVVRPPFVGADPRRG